MGESGGIPALLGYDTLGSGLFHPSPRREHKAVQACLTFNCLEFEVIELRVVEMLPQTQETDGVPRPHPVLDNISRILGRPVFGYVCQGNEIPGGAIHLNEHEAAKWLDSTTLRSVKWLPADEVLLPMIEKELSACC